MGSYQSVIFPLSRPLTRDESLLVMSNIMTMSRIIDDVVHVVEQCRRYPKGVDEYGPLRITERHFDIPEESIVLTLSDVADSHTVEDKHQYAWLCREAMVCLIYEAMYPILDKLLDKVPHTSATLLDWIKFERFVGNDLCVKMHWEL